MCMVDAVGVHDGRLNQTDVYERITPTCVILHLKIVYTYEYILRMYTYVKTSCFW